MSRISSRLPSIWVLLFAIALMLVVPLFAVGRSQWHSASTRVRSADEVSESADRLDVLLRLASALTAEQLSTSWGLATNEQLAGLPTGALRVIGLDFSATSSADRETVDLLLDGAGDEELTAAVDMVRGKADGGQDDVFDVGLAYVAVIDEVVAATNQELTTLTAAASGAGDVEVAVAAHAAEAIAGVQIVTVGLGGSWAHLAADPYVTPTVDGVQEFQARLALFNERLTNVDRLLVPDSALAEQWVTFTDSEQTVALLARYHLTAETFTIAGLGDREVNPSELDLSNSNIDELLALASDLSNVLRMSQNMQASTGVLVDTSLDDVEAAADSAVARANAERNETLLWILSSAALVALASSGLVILVARPVRRLADAAHKLGRGELATRLDERGPKEIRSGAHALNEALTSLQTAEAQANAMAEERLDDPVLSLPAPGRLGESLQAAVTRLAGSLADREEIQQRLAHETAHDGLTKLANRNAILRHLDSALARTRRASTPLALLVIDIDGFKDVNDLHGHQTGDAMLRIMGKRLVGIIRDGDQAGRLGGDEFVVVAEPVADVQEAIALGRRVLERVTEPTTFDRITLTPSVSIGIGFSPADGDLTSDELLRDADLAVYRAKSHGRGQIDVCDDELREQMQARTSLEQAIRQALVNDEFALHYQATVDTKTHRITSFEALLRWDRPEHGLVAPDAFIPIAERSDLILEIDRWVVDNAAAQLARWAGHPGLGAVPIAVNLSGRHFGAGTLCRDVHDALEANNVDPSLLTLEVTETAVLEDLTAAAHELGKLRELGVRVALDDFGTGYMSLAHLRGLPIDILKIDRSFVSALESDAERTLIQLIVQTGHLLGASVTAEGVETERQADALAEIGSDDLQGYLFSRPIDALATEQKVEGEARVIHPA